MEFLTVAAITLFVSILVGVMIILWGWFKGGRKVETIDQIIEKIQAFKPFRKYSMEVDYQIGLATYLQGLFGDVKIEDTRGDSRPDIVVNGNIALELKGPTSMEGLRTLPDKAMRYLQHFDNLVFVLFDIQVNKEELNRYLTLLKNTFPTTYVVVK